MQLHHWIPDKRIRHSLEASPGCHLWEMQTFIDPDLLGRLRVGPLASYLDTYLKRIEQQGFLPSSVPMQMYAIARFSKWLQIYQPDLYQVDESTIERFLQGDPGVIHACESAPLRRLLAMLRHIGACGQLRAQKAAIGRLIGQPPNGREPDVDR